MTTLEILTNTYRAFNARDIEAVLSVMHPEVDWPNGWEGGRVHGHQEVRDYWTRQWESVDPRVEPVGFRAEEDERGAVTVVEVHQIVRDLSGQVLWDGMVLHVYYLEGGLVRSMEIRHPSVGDTEAR